MSNNSRSVIETAQLERERESSPTSNSLIKSRTRVKQFGEVFTPKHIVQQMCDLCEPDISRLDGKVFEPTCGNGNFLVEILHRKLEKIKYNNKTQFESEIILALSSIYAVDIQKDNVEESRKRLRNIILEFTSEHKSSINFLYAVDAVLEHTILVGNTLTQQKELKFYDFKLNYKDFSFEISPHSLYEIEQNYAKTKKANISNLQQIFKETVSPPQTTPKRRNKPIISTILSPGNQPSSKQASLFREKYGQ